LNAHAKQTIRAILTTLADLEGGLMAESLLHGAVSLITTPPVTLSDFEQRLKYCQAQKWVNGIDGRLGTRKWCITDEGEAARREICE
jgi:hypothetical protein